MEDYEMLWREEEREEEEQWNREVIEEEMENALAGAKEEVADHFFSIEWFVPFATANRIFEKVWKKIERTITEEIESLPVVPIEYALWKVKNIRYTASDLYNEFLDEVNKDN